MVVVKVAPTPPSGGMTKVVPAVPGGAGSAHPGRWQQELCKCEPMGDCCYALMCPQCAWASARAAHDGSDCCFHFFTSTPCMNNNVLRINYGIGSQQECFEDFLVGTFCVPCAARRALVEARTYPLGPPTYTTTAGAAPLFHAGKFTGNMRVGEHNFTQPDKPMWMAGGLCDFWTCGDSFCYAILCPPCAAARTRNYLDGSDCCFNLFSNPLMFCQVYYMTRHYYGIQGDCVMDLFTVLFCVPCAIDRAYREVILQNAKDTAKACCKACCGGPPDQQMGKKKRCCGLC